MLPLKLLLILKLLPLRLNSSSTSLRRLSASIAARSASRRFRDSSSSMASAARSAAFARDASACTAASWSLTRIDAPAASDV
ncbi:hypothetical protein PLICRDRAFT_49469 [Plicaturopsis crispa FD-325 SS-3]|nr:hypothetical protein PLICRDRAFT_49469 [Plicaturopsis crispa FD-325 SS-3]